MYLYCRANGSGKPQNRDFNTEGHRENREFQISYRGTVFSVALCVLCVKWVVVSLRIDTREIEHDPQSMGRWCPN